MRQPCSIEGCEDAIGGAIAFRHATWGDRVGRTSAYQGNVERVFYLLIALGAVRAVVGGDMHTGGTARFHHLGEDRARITVSDQQVSIDRRAKGVERFDEIGLPDRACRLPQGRIHHE